MNSQSRCGSDAGGLLLLIRYFIRSTIRQVTVLRGEVSALEGRNVGLMTRHARFSIPAARHMVAMQIQVLQNVLAYAFRAARPGVKAS